MTQTITPLTVPPEWAEQVYAEDDGDSDVMHRNCCREDRALCGEEVYGEYCDEGEPGERCAICERIDELGLPCGAPFCRLRLAWRRWRS